MVKLSKERLIVQAKFLEMIERLNPKPETTEAIEEPLEQHIDIITE